MLFQIFALFFSSCFLGFGADLPDAQAEFISRFKNYTSFKELKVKFRQQKHIQELDSVLKAEGSLTVNRPQNRVRWEVTRPGFVAVEIQKDHQIVMESGTGKDRKTQVFDMKKMEKESKPLKNLSVWMDFNPQKIVESFQVFKVGETQFQFKPKAMDGAPFKMLTVKVSKKGYLQQMEMVENSDDKLVFDFDTPVIRP